MSESIHRNLVVDLNNNVFMIRYSTLKTPSRSQRKDPYATEMIFKELLSFIVKFANEHKCDSIVIACDAPKVWRRDIYPEYKGGDHSEDVYYDDCIAAANLTREFFETCTNSSVIEVPRCEADDVIAVFVKESEGVENIILSTDKDFVQLLSDTTFQYAPAQKKFREAEDPAYELFFKCIRGDRNDNIQSAFPRVRETKLQEAWQDPMSMQNLLETVRKDGKKVNDCYEFNKKLIDLTLQPEEFKQSIRDAILDAERKVKRFGEFKIRKFLAEHNLKKFSSMLEYKERPLRGTVKWKV